MGRQSCLFEKTYHFVGMRKIFVHLMTEDK